ncbi:MAG: carbohydrate kinase [Verrucomicrobiae bacterium]|nr:carbohydrate kinase [Verrucomicrobiae bacterium]
MPPRVQWKAALSRFSKLRVFVVGDVMLDQYVFGRVSRISPEAPVPVVDVLEDRFFPGGASNVARNLRSLGAKVAVLGILGNDAAGRTLSRTLRAQGVDVSGLLVDDARPTTLKTRVIAQHQQVVRFDRESRRAISPKLAAQTLAFARRAIPRMDAVVFEDYGKGLISQEFLDICAAEAKRARVPVFADPNMHHRLDYDGLTGITPNRMEAFWLAGEAATDPAADPLRDRPLLAVGEKLLASTRVENVLITLGEHGMCLFRAGRRPHHIPTAAQEVFDVSGAGDTAISAFALGMGAGLDSAAAAFLANQAAGIVVGKAGTATASPTEILARLSVRTR